MNVRTTSVAGIAGVMMAVSLAVASGPSGRSMGRCYARANAPSRYSPVDESPAKRVHSTMETGRYLAPLQRVLHLIQQGLSFLAGTISE